MNISKTVGIVTTAIPIVGILIGGITFGVNFKTDVETIKEDIANQKAINETIPDPYDDELLWLSIDNIDIPDKYDDTNIYTSKGNFWKHTGNFVLEAIITPYDVNGNGNASTANLDTLTSF